MFWADPSGADAGAYNLAMTLFNSVHGGENITFKFGNSDDQGGDEANYVPHPEPVQDAIQTVVGGR